jgi:L-ascorbate metabolism protein UlaG (beta-lactamase superfamily)
MAKDMIDRIHWLGHDSFRVDAEKVIYFDPWEVGGGTLADLILVSHEHYDHCSPEDVARISGPDTVILTEADSAKKLKGHVKTMRPGDTLEIGSIRVRAVPAYNIDKKFHPKAKNWLGFIVQVEGTTIYHAGDTDFIPEMKSLKTDIALLPVSGTYVMTADQAIQAARAIGPRIVVPMHYGKIVGSDADAKKLAAALKKEMTVVLKTPE